MINPAKRRPLHINKKYTQGTKHFVQWKVGPPSKGLNYTVQVYYLCGRANHLLCTRMYAHTLPCLHPTAREHDRDSYARHKCIKTSYVHKTICKCACSLWLKSSHKCAFCCEQYISALLMQNYIQSTSAWLSEHWQMLHSSEFQFLPHYTH